MVLYAYTKQAQHSSQVDTTEVGWIQTHFDVIFTLNRYINASEYVHQSIKIYSLEYIAIATPVTENPQLHETIQSQDQICIFLSAP